MLGVGGGRVVGVASVSYHGSPPSHLLLLATPEYQGACQAAEPRPFAQSDLREKTAQDI